jgi:hypothetical protein
MFVILLRKKLRSCQSGPLLIISELWSRPIIIVYNTLPVVIDSWFWCWMHMIQEWNWKHEWWEELSDNFVVQGYLENVYLLSKKWTRRFIIMFINPDIESCARQVEFNPHPCAMLLRDSFSYCLLICTCLPDVSSLNAKYSMQFLRSFLLNHP